MDIPDPPPLNAVEAIDASSMRKAAAPAGQPPMMPFGRRVVLRAGAIVPVGVGLTSLAACGDDSSSDPSTPEAETEPGGDGATDPTADSEGTGPEPAAGFPSADVPVGGATYDEASDTVYSQPTEGEFRAFDATCPHQGCAVSQFSEGSLRCPCHGSMFDPDSGDVISGPAPTGLTARSVTVQGDDLVVG